MPGFVTICFRDVMPAAALETRIRERARRLECHADRIVGCQAVVEALHRRGAGRRLYRVGLSIAVPGCDIEVGRGDDDPGDEDVLAAADHAFDAAERRLEQHGRRLPSGATVSRPPRLATVASIFPDHGFVRDGCGNEIYFHEDAVIGGFERLAIGDQVRLVVAQGELLRAPQAARVAPTGRRGAGR